MHIKVRQNILLFIAIGCGFLVIIYPSASSVGAMLGLKVWSQKVLPSLFPFMIISSFMYYTGLSERVTLYIYKFIKRIVHCSQNAIFIFITSIFSGYPMAAKLVSMYCADNRLTHQEAEAVLVFSSVCSPVFIAGTIGVTMLNDLRAARIIALSHYLSAIINGLIFVFLLSSHSTKKATVSNTTNKSSSNPALSPFNALTKSVTTSCSTQLLIGGFITIFSVFISLLDACHLFSFLSLTTTSISPTLAIAIKPLISGFFEMANGSSAMSSTSLTIQLKIMFITLFISWGGLSIHCQAVGLLYDTSVSTAHYLIAKLLHGLLSVVVSFLLVCLFY